MSFSEEHSDEYYDVDDEYTEETERVPNFGCACVNPLVIDDVCASEIEQMEEQSRIRSSKLVPLDGDGFCICANPIGPEPMSTELPF